MRGGYRLTWTRFRQGHIPIESKCSGRITFGPITALTWALEIGDVSGFHSIKQAISYCGLCGAEKSSADKMLRTPISKQRNKHIQHVLVEAAKLAPQAVPRTGPDLREGDAER